MVQNVSGAIIKNRTNQDDLRKKLEKKIKQVEELRVKYNNAEDDISIHKANEINLREILKNNEGDLE